MKLDPSLYHPGKVEATQWGMRYGRNYSGTQIFDDHRHQWHLAKEKNFGPWSCCGKAVNSPGCKVRKMSANAAREKKFIKFLTHGNIVGVAHEEGNCWRLDDDRIAKKRTEGDVWKWHNDPLARPRATEEKKFVRFLADGNIVGVMHEEEKCWRLDGGRIAKKRTEGEAWKWHVGPLPRPRATEEKKFIRFLANGNIVGITHEEESRWRLDGGRFAQKRTEGKVWKWHDGPLPRSGAIEEKKFIRFLAKGNIVGVAHEEEKCWRLDGGRIAKKRTQGETWKWHDGHGEKTKKKIVR